MSAGTVFANLRLNIQDFSRNLERAANQMARFAATSANSSMQSNRQFAQYGRQIADATRVLDRHNFGLKDTVRIVQGIVVSQAFYRMAGAISDATRSVMAFNEALDYAQVTYSALFRDQQLSTSFLDVLREHAENTVFSYEQLADSSKKLLAYNIPKENLMYVMEGLTNLGAMSGDAAALDRIALALGQIYTRGKLSAEEMRQLANAYVPIYDIVKSKFGLTDDQMGRVGDLNLPAHEVINAVVEYANENFGAVGDAAMYTITGLKQKISDSLKNLAVDILKPFTQVYKSALKAISDGLESVTEAYKTGGLGGVFEHLVPSEDAQQRIRQFISNLQALLITVRNLASVAFTFGSSFATSLVNAFNVVAPVITSAMNVFVNALGVITNNATGLRILTAMLVTCAAGWVLFKVKALSAMAIAAVAKVIYAVAGAVIFLSRALAASPIVTALILVGAGIAGIAANSERASTAITNLFDNLSGLNGGGGGAGSDGILKVEDQLGGAADNADAFNNSLKGTQDAIDGVEDSLNGAGGAAKKAAAGLLSFDEVFKLNEQKAGGGGSGDYNLDDMLEGLEGLGGGIGDSLIPEIPDFSGFGEGFVQTLLGTLFGKLALAGFGAALAKKIGDILADSAKTANWSKAAKSIVGGIGKAIMGASIGLAIDAFASLLTDKLWETLEQKLELSESSGATASFAATLGSMIGGAIGLLVGGIGGSAIGAAIGHLAGGIVGLLWDEINGAFSNTAIFGGAGILGAIAKAFGGSISQLPMLVNAGSLSGIFKNIGQLFTATGAKALLKGGVIGAAIGFVCDGIAALLWRDLEDKFNLSANSTDTAKVGQTIGSVLGTVIGGILGGPPGALIGTAIGTFAGGFVGLFWEKITEFFAPVTERISLMVQGIVKGFGDAATGIADWVSTTWESLSGWFTGTYTGFSTWWNDTFGGIRTWWNDTVNLFSDWDSINSDTLSTWWDDTKRGVAEWAVETLTSFISWKDETGEGFSTWKEETIGKFTEWKTGVTAPISNFVAETAVSIYNWCQERKKDFNSWKLETSAKISGWVDETVKNISDWVDDQIDNFNDFKDETIRVIGGFALASIKAISQWASDTWQSVKDWFDGLVEDIAGWWDDAWDISTWTSGWAAIGSWFSGLFNDIHDWFSGLGSNMGSWWSSIWSGFKATITKSNTGISLNPSVSIPEFATGGIVNRDQIARVAEGNKAEAIIPLQNASAMQPFVDAVANGLTGNILPTLLATRGNGGYSSDMPPMYVGTLIADERGIKELYKKFELIQVQESARRGLVEV